MTSQNILIVDSVNDYLVKRLNEKGFHCETNQTITLKEFIVAEDKYIGLVIRNRFPIDHYVLNSKKKLRFIVRIGSGVEHIDLESCKQRGVACLSTPEGNAPAVAEHCLGFLLSALKHIPSADREVREGLWLRNQNKGHEISSRIIGIIGFGNTGHAFAKLLSAFGCKILVYDKFKSGFTEPYIKEVTLDELCKKCDVISLHINYMPENYHFADKDFIKKCTQNPIFINSSRGLAVNTEDLVDALRNEQLSFACLDVLEYENVHLENAPLQDWEPAMQELASMKNVLLTPHIAGQTYESSLRHAEIAYKKIINYFEEKGTSV